ncbi:uncharacterized protein LOC122455863 [Dermochelys coriacea]|uniref:uncharacterized protein LOC122455863 n=1 Tax=Dermochelys coriacea TaxID=27794 RepID=UPI001CA8E538|nr:uncharacterized protein LOC122455863 [Dermochelys coriacea]
MPQGRGGVPPPCHTSPTPTAAPGRGAGCGRTFVAGQQEELLVQGGLLLHLPHVLQRQQLVGGGRGGRVRALVQGGHGAGSARPMGVRGGPGPARPGVPHAAGRLAAGQRGRKPDAVNPVQGGERPLAAQARRGATGPPRSWAGLEDAGRGPGRGEAGLRCLGAAAELAEPQVQSLLPLGYRRDLQALPDINRLLSLESMLTTTGADSSGWSTHREKLEEFLAIKYPFYDIDLL